MCVSAETKGEEGRAAHDQSKKREKGRGGAVKGAAAMLAGRWRVCVALLAAAGLASAVPCPSTFRLPAGATQCSVVTFAGGLAKPTTDVAAEHQLWKEGMELYANWTNDNGGLRLGGNRAGYVNVSIEHPPGNEHADYINLYTGLLRNPEVHILLAPIWKDAAVHVIEAIKDAVNSDGVPAKPILVTSSVPEMFSFDYPYVWAVDSPTSRMTAAKDIVDMLYAHDARTFTVVGETTPFGQYTLENITAEVSRQQGAKMKLKRLAESQQLDPYAIHEAFQEAREEDPNGFVAIGGHTNGFTAVLDFFKENRYVPRAAVYVGGLATTTAMRAEQEREQMQCGGEKQHCFLFDQWIGTVTWTADMNHPGPEGWISSVPAPYHNRYTRAVDGHNRSRYIGGASDFADVAALYLRAEPTEYHASAAATLLLFQLAVELADSGRGLPFENSTDGEALKTAIMGLNAESTFFGPMRLNSHWNVEFQFGIGQFQRYESSPRLIGPAALRPEAQLIYPAEWPCKLLIQETDQADHRRYASRSDGPACQHVYQILNRWEVWVALSIVFCAVAVACGARRRGYKCCKQEEQKPLLRASLLGSEKLPSSVLGQKDVRARWASAQMAADDPEVRKSFSSSVNSHHRSSAPQVEASGGRTHKALANSRAARVFFSDENVRELQPERKGGDPGWQSRSNQIGVGAYGSVFKATWRGNEVAVKVLRLPEEPKNKRDDAKDALREKLEEIVTDFTKEVEICCDLAHPNLVTLLGYATQPDLMLMQELMQGNSIDQQLYNEKWKPTTAQILKVALDVASGMAYLHTAFQEQRSSKRKTRSGKSHVIDKPVIHRDLKSPNLLLRYPPPPRGQEGDARDLVCKISDFGLSRDKKLEDTSAAGTAMMTGCGSILWMAPEILLGAKYNEKVDVYSYAMCLVELVHRNLPWHGTGVGQQAIPVRVTRGQRPEAQLRKCRPEGLTELIGECWKHEPHARPEFPDIMFTCNDMYLSHLKEMKQTGEPSRRSGGASYSRPASKRAHHPDRIDE